MLAGRIGGIRVRTGGREFAFIVVEFRFSGKLSERTTEAASRRHHQGGSSRNDMSNILADRRFQQFHGSE